MDQVTSALLQYGAVGIMAIVGGVVSKILFDRWGQAQDAERQRMAEALARETARGDRLEAELGRLNEAVRNGYVDAITRANDAVNQAGRAVADSLAALRRG